MNIRIDRLEKLIEVLEEVRRQELPLDMKEFAERDECGTVYCAMGYAALNPYFQSLGLILDFDDDNVGRLFYHTGDKIFGGMDAVIEIFNIRWNEADKLFGVGSYRHNHAYRVSIRMVIDKVKAFIKEKKEGTSNESA